MPDDPGHDPLEELAALPTLTHPTVSPDGDRIAYYYDVTGRNELHVLDVETGESARWSDGEVPRNARWHLRWDADGERVLFHDDDAGDEQNDVRAIDADGSVETVAESEGQNALHDIDPDGEFDTRRETPIAALSDRQQEALLAAYDLGYYDHPRRATHEEIGERLDCAPNTVCDHLQKAEKAVMAEVLDLAVEA
jgi:Tol biopolymer transport system component